MTTVAETATPQRDRSRDRALVRAWLYAVAALVVLMVLVGGATRLTDSGLSITEWKPIHGMIPPLSEAEWQEEFALYKQIPEYQVLNRGMSLDAFKGIYWWEWSHRFLGRLIGVVFFVPFIILLATGRIERKLVPPLAGLFVLGGLQGAVGWWMVTSGLAVRTDVSQYRLAIHLTLACFILAAIVWIATGLRSVHLPSTRRAVAGAVAIVVLVFVQIFLGGLVAGLDAGLASDTWPLMNGALVPGGLLHLEPVWRNAFENALTVQFDHRIAGYVLLAVAAVQAVAARRTPLAGRALMLFVVVLVQAALGVANVLMAVPLHLALTHQLGAVVVLWIAVANLRVMWATKAA